MRVLLTGAAGFVGGHVRSALIERGHDVVAIDAMLGSAHGTDAETPAGVLRVDVRDGEVLDRVLRGVVMELDVRSRFHAAVRDAGAFRNGRR